MKQEKLPRIFAADQQPRWLSRHGGIWSLQDADLDSVPTLSILTTLWDQPRWLEAYHLYDRRGSELFEQICDLPEYYLTRTENAILETHAGEIIANAPVQCIAELGAGYSKKTVHLLTEQLQQRGKCIFAPIDVSLSALLASRQAVQRDFSQIEFHGLHSRYEDGFSAFDRSLTTLFVFLGSTIGNFNHTDFPRFFRALSAAMGPDDFLLLGADRVKPVKILEDAYNDSRGVTAEFILNVFANINRVLQSNFDLTKIRYHSWFNPEWQQIEMYGVAAEQQRIYFPTVETSFQWRKDEKILVEISRKFDPLRLQEQLRFFGLLPVAHFTDPNQWFSVLLFKKQP
ncbi:MAG TPA: L-histidine N(alpha)-methyltransferase [Candidatus Binatia bacterium]|nr:L-histidine N(alpha)-methyltransferase [Candidatus Binatia bacterium]